jgi:glycerol-3-phosphate dehydrogenase
LAQGRIGLVREASIEKGILRKIAPHLADPLPFLFPAYTDNPEWRLWQLKIGVKVYDLLCGLKNLGDSSWLSSAEMLKRVPTLASDHLAGGVRYFDGFTNDARLVLDSLRSAERAGARPLNYCRFIDAKRSTHWECEVQDMLPGTAVQLRASSIVNATGAWSGILPHSRVRLRLTKGCHVVVDRTRIPVPEVVVMTEGKRILFAIPWGERTILGTTDTDYAESLDDVSANAADIRYVLEVVNRFFPNSNITRDDIISSWAGLRPLIADPDGAPSDISRSHTIESPEPGWFDVAGGKLTTYRRMAEETVDRVVTNLKPRREVLPCRTALEPLLPDTETAGISGTLPPEFSRKAVEHFVTNEWAVEIGDVMLRRAGWHYYLKDSAQKAVLVAEWMGHCLEWSAVERSRMLEGFLRAPHLSVSAFDKDRPPDPTRHGTDPELA